MYATVGGYPDLSKELPACQHYIDWNEWAERKVRTYIGTNGKKAKISVIVLPTYCLIVIYSTNVFDRNKYVYISIQWHVYNNKCINQLNKYYCK